MNEELNNSTTLIFLIRMGTDSEDLDASKYELFDALGHPFRVKLITVLTEHPLSFAELKHVMNIKSSGHLSFHLGKLHDLITATPDGKYQLSEYGHEALHLITTINQRPYRSERRDVVPHTRRTSPPLITIVSLILIIVLLPFAIYGVNRYFQPETVQGVVLDKSTTSRLGEDAQYTQWYVLMLRLITKDSVNQYPVGEIHSYLFQGDTYDAINIGDLITGIPNTSTKDVIDLIEITPFVKPPIINTGYVVHSNIGFSWSGAFPWFSCQVHNLGEHSIVALIVKLNQTFLPFSLGVSTTSSIPPSQIGQGFAPLRWYDADVKQIMDFTPVLGVKYPVTLTIIFDDDTVITHAHMVNLTEPIPSVIAFLVTSEVHIDVNADLFMRGIHNGLLSLSLRNVWWNETISHITILFEDEHVIDTMTNIRTGNYWAGSSILPLQVWTHLSYNVTIHIQTASGKGSTLTTMMFPQYLTTKLCSSIR
jgi:hypothetical protein